ncbi:hypothetical protein HGRIS_005290 [Hohenbuehelia grisea]|uniref:Nitronate monooxygenase domain-containing protein n=1 Tax=Hohenbuehelia grisea TaxID=104357 RepID=A0ABR3JEJ5_9AGAR
MDNFKPIHTKLTSLLDIQTPIISAPMYYGSTPDLAAAISKAGGFGFVAAGFDSSADMVNQIRAIRDKVGSPPAAAAQTGVGLLGWILDRTESSTDPRIPAILDERPKAIWFAFGDDLGPHIVKVRAYEADKGHKTLVFVIVNTVIEAQRAAEEWRADVLVVQGHEAGGHGGAEAPPLFSLLPAVLQSLPRRPCVVAAGGISTGAQIAALLALGADGVVLGTRFLFTPESMYSDAMKRVLVHAGLNDSVRSVAFDEMHRTPVKTGWPIGIDGRAIAKGIIDDSRNGLSLEERFRNFDEAKSRGDTNHLIIWAGVGAGLVNEVEAAADVLHKLHEETLRALSTAAQLVA